MPANLFKILMLISLFSILMPIQAQDILLGVYSSDKPSSLYKKYSPMIDYLTNDLTQRLKQPVIVNLKIFTSEEQTQNAMVTGDIDFARFNPVSYILVKQRNPRIKLLVMEKNAAEVVKSVAMNHHTTGSLNESTLKKSNRNYQTNAIHRISTSTKTWLTRSRLSADIFIALQQSLINLQDEPTLKAHKITGFFKTNDKAFDSVRLDMKAAQQ